MRVEYALGVKVCGEELLKVLRAEAFNEAEYEEGVELLEALLGEAPMFGDDDLEEDEDDFDLDDDEEDDLLDLLDEDIFIIMVDEDDDDELTFDGELN